MAIFPLTKSFGLVPGLGFCAPWGPVVAVIVVSLPVESATFLKFDFYIQYKRFAERGS